LNVAFHKLHARTCTKFKKQRRQYWIDKSRFHVASEKPSREERINLEIVSFLSQIEKIQIQIKQKLLTQIVLHQYYETKN